MNDYDNNANPFSVDLLQNSKDHMSFLNGLHSSGVTLHRPSKKSLERYRDQWLPMVHRCNKRSHKNEKEKLKLIPPPDIAWLFHCHRLAPFHYAKYCRKEFGIKKANIDFLLPDAEAPFSFQLESGDVHCGTKADCTRTQRRWEKYYPEEPFFLEPNGGDEEETKDSLLLNGFDLLASAERQSSFLWHISSPHFTDDQFLKAGIDRYHKFILLRKLQLDDHQTDSTKHPSMIVPTYDIDLMWHTHILSGLSFYHNDCKKILGGSTLNHDDGVGEDRSEGGTLDVGFKETSALWKHSYGEDYSIPGGMYKGEPPTHFYFKEWSSDSFSSAELLYAAAAGVQPFMRFVGIQGATSTNQVNDADCNRKEVVWCWKETRTQMSEHDADKIFGNPDNCWIKYDSLSNGILESAFQSGCDTGDFRGNCDIGNGYTVNFSTAKQTKTSTGFQRDVKRFVQKYVKKDTPVVARAIAVDDTPRATFIEEPQATVIQEAPIRGWTLLSETAPDGLPAFQMAAARSKSRGVIANTKKRNYVFGKKGNSIGYFHITTREAYEILTDRVRIMSKKQEHNVAMEQNCNCWGFSDANVERAEQKLRDMKDVELIAKERAKTRGPGDKVKLPSRLLKDKKHFSNDGAWIFHDSYYVAGGGCGYFTSGTGYSGGNGGACGGGGCEAGACGGGDGGGACGAAGKWLWTSSSLCWIVWKFVSLLTFIFANGIPRFFGSSQ